MAVEHMPTDSDAAVDCERGAAGRADDLDRMGLRMLGQGVPSYCAVRGVGRAGGEPGFEGDDDSDRCHDAAEDLEGRLIEPTDWSSGSVRIICSFSSNPSGFEGRRRPCSQAGTHAFAIGSLIVSSQTAKTTTSAPPIASCTEAACERSEFVRERFRL
jgi:hypothetical protein